MSERVLVLGVVVGIGLLAWKGWGKTAGTPLPYPAPFFWLLVAFGLLGILATFAAPLAAVLAVGLLVAVALGAADGLVAKGAPA